MSKHPRKSENGFTLIEILIGLAISSLILAGLSAAMSSVNRAFDKTTAAISSQNEIGAALEVAAGDISRIEPVRDSAKPGARFLFSGSAKELIYVLAERSASNRQGVYWVRLQVEEAQDRIQLIRSRTPYGSADISTAVWSDDVTLINSQNMIEFSYRAPRRGLRDWGDDWVDNSSMPEQVRITITDKATGRLKVPHFVETLKVETNALCINPDAPECTGVTVPQ